MAETPETSEHTSIKERIHPAFNLTDAIARQTEQQALNEFSVPLKPLLGFEGVIRNGFQRGTLNGSDERLNYLPFFLFLSLSALPDTLFSTKRTALS